MSSLASVCPVVVSASFPSLSAMSPPGKAPCSSGCPYSSSPVRWVPEDCRALVCEFHVGPLPLCDECIPGVLVCQVHFVSCGNQSEVICSFCKRALCRKHVGCFCKESDDEKVNRNRGSCSSTASAASLSCSGGSGSSLSSSLSPLSSSFSPSLGLASGTLPFTERCASSLSSVHTFGRGAHFTHPVAWGTKGLVVTRSESLARAWSCFCSFFISFRFFRWDVQFFSFRFQLLFSFRSFGCRFRCMSEGKAKEGCSPPQQCHKRWGEPLSMCLDSVSGGVGVRRVASSST